MKMYCVLLDANGREMNCGSSWQQLDHHRSLDWLINAANGLLNSYEHLGAQGVKIVRFSSTGEEVVFKS